MAAFNRGKLLFEKTFLQTNGLGPTFNASSCAECHGETQDVTGGTGDEIETHFTSGSGFPMSCDALGTHGGFVHQDSVTPLFLYWSGLVSEPFPTAKDNISFSKGLRSTPDLFGFGLVEAIPDSMIVKQQDPSDLNGDGISGRVHFTSSGRIGRFGRKANEGNLRLFNAGALINEMGITNQFNMAENIVYGYSTAVLSADPTPEPEISSTDLEDLNSFVKFLAPPPGVLITATASHGSDVFNSIGCAKCHVPQYTTGNGGSPALSNKIVRPFSDFLLHDMGPELSDICLDQSARSEFRTEPLMGARFMTVFLHDGRATTIEQAVSFHGGEAANSRARWNVLTAADRAAVIEYINSQ